MSIDETVATRAARAAAGAQRHLSLDDAAEWEALLRRIPHGIGHTHGFCRALRHTAAGRILLHVDEIGAAPIVCPIEERAFEGRTDVATPYGFSGFVAAEPDPAFPGRWRAFAESRGYVCGYLALHPVLSHPSLAADDELVTHQAVYVLDLRQDPERLFDRLSTNRRRQLRSIGEPIVDPEPLRTFFLERYAGFFAARGAGPAYRFAAATMRELLELDGVLLMGAGRPDRVEAVSLFGWTPHGADFLFNVSLPEGRGHSTALIWWAAVELQARGVPHLNLGGGVRSGDALAEFKRRFGGDERPLRSLRQVYDPVAYDALCRASDADPRARDGYFPAYRR